MMNDKMQEMKKKINLLNEAAKAYYDEDREIMPNIEYDKLYDELEALEQETGVILANSPTQRVGYEVVSALPTEVHPTPMLSLDKTKSPEELKSWLKDKKGVLSWKLDGLTVALTYNNGRLLKAVTRGDGTRGEVITPNARTFENLPLNIAFKGELVIRGEAIIKYSDFEKINERIEDVALKYKNPRNLSSGSVRQLNSEITATRHVQLYAFSLVQADDVDFKDSKNEQLEFLKNQGFDVVDHYVVDATDIEERVHWFAEEAGKGDLPSDGLVLVYDQISYGDSLGETSKFPRNSIAFKWEDELAETTLQEIEWSTSRTGLINPIAIFAPVDIEGTTVSRASVHNISILEELKLGIGDHIKVYKANMIIPQIAENLDKTGPVEIPKTCPVCGGDAIIKDESGVKFLYCTNENCLARQIKAFTHFVSRNAMNIDGLSEATLEKFINKGFVTEFGDIFKLDRYADAIKEMDGFGEKSYNNIIAAINTARHTTQVRLLNALGVPNIGLANAKLIAKACHYDWGMMSDLNEESLIAIDGIGEVMAKDYVNYFKDEKNRERIEHILNEISFEDVKENKNPQTLGELTFVITGTLELFANRNTLKEVIENHGGKVASSVSSNTDYLINNDVESNSSKNKKAKELGTEIIDEKMFKKILEGERKNA